MLDTINNDNAVFMNDFTQSMVIVMVNSEVINLKGIFDAEHTIFNEADANVSGYAPVVTCKTADINNVQEDDMITINGSHYRIIDRQDDGTGMTKLMLRVTS